MTVLREDLVTAPGIFEVDRSGEDVTWEGLDQKESGMYMLCAHWAITYGSTMAQAVQTMRRLRGVSPLGFPQGKARTDESAGDHSLAQRCFTNDDGHEDEDDDGDHDDDDDEAEGDEGEKDEQETRPGIEQEDEGKGQSVPMADLDRAHEELAALGKIVTVLERFGPGECATMVNWLSAHFVKDRS